MADKKKQSKKSSPKQSTKGRGASPSSKSEGHNKASAERVIYKYHRKFMGGGLVGLIILAALIGTEVIPLHTPGGSEGRTDIKVLERENDPTKPTQSVVARDGEGSEARITIHTRTAEAQPSEGETDAGTDNGARQNTGQYNTEKRDMAANINANLEKLQRITQGQQQMIRMLNQKQEQYKQTLTEQIQNLSLQVTNALEADQPTLLKVNESMTTLQLRQDTLFFQNQWQLGLLTSEDVFQWQTYAQNRGYAEAAQVAGALAESLESFGALNRQALRQTALTISQNPQLSAADGSISDKQNTATEEQPEQTWWQKLKSRLSGFVSVRRVDEATKQTPVADPVLQERLTIALAEGNMSRFWQIMLKESDDKQDDPVVSRLRVLVDAHMTQMNAFQQLYRALTAAQKKAQPQK